MTDDLKARNELLTDVLKDCQEYFNTRARATWPHGEERPNVEMKLLTRIHEVLRP